VGKRSKGRALLLQAMYAARQSGRSLTDCFEDQIELQRPAPETAEFVRELGRKVVNHGLALENSLGPLLANWDLARVGILERLILTIGLVELHHSPEVPPRVVLNEACELARTFCDEGAVKFVNGVLDRARTDQDKEPEA
jgi:transcription antitermination protein NusB